MTRIFATRPTAAQDKQGQFRQEPIHTHSYLVQTVFGVTIVSANSLVYVKIGNEYVRKPIDEVKKGEEVLFSKEGIPGITIEQAGEALAKSTRYAATQPVLFRQLPDGSYTTAFRYALTNEVNLDNSQEIAASEYIQARLIEADAPSVSLNHIRYGWLGGKVIAPRNREAVIPALQPIVPELSKMLEPAFNEAYKLYIVIRQTVMRAVSTILKGKGLQKTEGEEEEPQEPVPKGISTRPEIKLVAEHFASDVTERYAAGRVLDVRELLSRREAQEREERGEFFRGVVTDEVNDPEIKIKPLKKVWEERSVVLPIIHRIIYEFLRREGIGLRPRNLLDREIPGSAALIQMLELNFGFIKDSETMHRQAIAKLEKAGIRDCGKYLPPPQAFNRAITLWKDPTDLFANKINSGELDSVYGLPTGTLAKLLDYFFKLDRTALTKEFNYFDYLTTLISAKRNLEQRTHQAISTRIEEQEIREIDRRLRKLGLKGIGRGETDEILTAINIGMIWDLHYLLPFDYEAVYEGKITPSEALSNAGHKKEVLGRIKLAEDQVALQVLREMGFGELEKLYPKDNELMKPYF